MILKVGMALALTAVLTLTMEPASAGSQSQRRGGRGCGALVAQVHPELQGQALDKEVAKCRRDADAYIKASGL